jgi:polar amino acid transport system permease protein
MTALSGEQMWLFAMALGTTMWITAAGLAIAVVLALPLALLLNARQRLISVLARLYVELMRGSPLVILLFLAYYGGPSIGVTLNAITVGIAMLGFYGAAYIAEIFRAGLNAVPRGEVEAGQVLGLSRMQILRYIRLPQMARTILAPATGQTINLIKESAVLSIITVAELTKIAGEISNLTFSVITPYLTAALLYWGLVEVVSRASFAVERRLHLRSS